MCCLAVSSFRVDYAKAELNNWKTWINLVRIILSTRLFFLWLITINISVPSCLWITELSSFTRPLCSKAHCSVPFFLHHLTISHGHVSLTATLLNQNCISGPLFVARRQSVSLKIPYPLRTFMVVLLKPAKSATTLFMQYLQCSLFTPPRGIYLPFLYCC